MIYNWKRFWRARDGRLRLDDQGFLSDPEPFGGALNPDLRTLEQISPHPCLGLLGEPGIGKSTVLKGVEASLEEGTLGDGSQVLVVDLRSVGSDVTFHRAVTDHVSVQSWRLGGGVLHLLLDGFDECLLRVQHLVAVLLQTLEGLPRERLRLWVACRTAQWPSSLEGGLRKLWGESHVGVFELSPLRRSDVVEAAQARGLDAEPFVADVMRADAVALATRPITLEFLLTGYGRDGRLHPSRSALYRRGCRRLCEESEARREAGLGGTLSADERFAIAQRVAAALVFGGRAAVATGPERGVDDADDVSAAELVGGRERCGGVDVDVTPAAVDETLRIGPFSSRGLRRLGFSHQTYAEFLAAAYLVDHDVPVEQIMRLLVHPEGPDRRLVPQLHEVAAWLATMNVGVFERVLETDSDVLLRADISTATDEARRALTANLLRLSATGQVRPRPFDEQAAYERLAHPGIAEQLRAILCDRTADLPTRILALEIARACAVEALADELAELALESSEPQRLREAAAATVARLSSPGAKARLKPLLRLPAEQDPDDELRGCSLMACWPEHLTTEELLEALTPSREESFLGAYWAFLRKPPKVSASGLPQALLWIETVPGAEVHQAGSRQALVAGILIEAFLHLDAPGVEAPFLASLERRLRKHEPLSFDPNLQAAIDAEPAKRRRLAQRLVRRLAAVSDAAALARQRPRLLRSEDVEWLIVELRSASTGRQPTVAELIAGVFDVVDDRQRDLVLAAKDDVPALAERLVWTFGPIELKSAIAQAMRANYEWSQSTDATAPPPTHEPELQEVVAWLLTAIEGGRPVVFARLAFELSCGTGAKRYQSLCFADDLTALPAWKELDAATSARVIRAARAFLDGPEPPGDWLGTSTTPGEVLAGYQALALLLTEAPELLAGLPVDVWRRWAPVTVGVSFEAESSTAALIDHAYRQVPEVVLNAVGVVVNRGLATPGGDRLLGRLARIWSTEVADLVRAAARKEGTEASVLKTLMPFLLRVGNGTARPLVEEVVRERSSATDARGVVAAAELLTSAADGGWSVVWPEIARDAAFGRAVASEVATRIHDPYSQVVAARLTEEQLGDLFVWLAKAFPFTEDPIHGGVFFPGVRDQIKDLRDSLLVALRGRGTRAACDVMDRVVAALPEAGFLRYSLLEAQAKFRAASWIRPAPREILRLASDQSKRLVRSGCELRYVVLQGLSRIQVRLQGETPEASLLWNEWDGGKRRPKKENLLSDYIKNQLERDLGGRGVVLNREVEIRKGLGTGERTDIHVCALAPKDGGDDSGAIRLIIEAKGCWHPKLGSDMEDQLVNGYLRDNPCQDGIYLVSWFDPAAWDENDDRRARAAQTTKAALQRTLDAQARSLSKDGLTVLAVVLDASLRTGAP